MTPYDQDAAMFYILVCFPALVIFFVVGEWLGERYLRWKADRRVRRLRHYFCGVEKVRRTSMKNRVGVRWE